LNLSNKFGKVDVRTWAKDRAKVEVTIVVKANSESQAKVVFDRIRVDFSSEPAFVRANTVIEPGKGGRADIEFEVNYTAYMPATASLDLSNSFGEANVATINGKAKVNVQHGTVRLDGVGYNLHLDLDQSTCTVARSGDVFTTISNSKLNLNNVGNVHLTSKNSKLSVENGQHVTANSRYDELAFGKVAFVQCDTKYGAVTVVSAGGMNATGQYTTYTIERLRENGSFNLQSGTLFIEQVDKGFTNINLVGKDSDFKIEVEDGASYTLDASGSYAAIAYPAGLKVIYDQDQGNTRQVRGHLGTQSAQSAIKANLTHSGLKVKQ
jgi:hypothetical protein